MASLKVTAEIANFPLEPGVVFKWMNGNYLVTRCGKGSDCVAVNVKGFHNLTGNFASGTMVIDAIPQACFETIRYIGKIERIDIPKEL